MIMRNRAFTLIELLVVIAIIALLASIAMPVFRTAQERARGIQDANDMKQIGVGFAAYLGDNNDSLSGLTTTGSTAWAGTLGPGTAANYVSDLHVFQSPFDAARPFDGTNLSYGMNANLISPPPTLNGFAVLFTNFTHPSALLVLGPSDSASGGTYPTFSGKMSSPQLLKSGGGTVGVMGNQNIMNVLYGDWHVGTMTKNNFNTATYNSSQFWSPLAP